MMDLRNVFTSIVQKLKSEIAKRDDVRIQFQIRGNDILVGADFSNIVFVVFFLMVHRTVH